MTIDAKVLFGVLRPFVLANFFWALGGLIPSLDADWLLAIRMWFPWLSSFLAALFFFIAFLKANAALRAASAS